MFNPLKQEAKGSSFILISAVLWGLYPIMVNQGVQVIPPIFFSAIGILVACFVSFFYALYQGHLNDLRKSESYREIIMLTLCIVIIPSVLFFIGTSSTSGLNTSMLMLSELIFLLIFAPFFGEKNTTEKCISATAVFIGAGFLLYNGTPKINSGDILVFLSALTYPIGNFYTKKVLNTVSPEVILFIRSLIGGCFLLAISFAFEPQIDRVGIIAEYWKLILLVGVLFMGFEKIMWYEGLKRLDISKATTLLMTFPLFSILTLLIFYSVEPTTYQWIGIIFMALGMFFAVKRKSIDPNLTKYAKKL